MDCSVYRDLVAVDIDGRLGADERAAARAHVSACPACESLRRAQDSIKAILRERAPRHVTPAAVRQRIAAALDKEATPAEMARRGWRVSRRRLVVAGSIAAVLLLALVPWWRSSTPDLLAVLSRDVQAVSAQEVRLAVRTDDVARLRRFYRDTGNVDFDRTVADLGAAGFRPVGGTVAHVGTVKTTFTVYEGMAGQIVCRRFRVGAIPLPRGGERIGGAEFFTVDGITVRLQRDGDVICALATTMPRGVFVRSLLGPSSR